jgi:hypothetical protein
MRSRLSALYFNIIHDNEMYGQIVAYYRAKGMVQDTEGFITIRVCVNGRDPVELRFDAGRFDSVAEEGRRLESALAN